MTSNTPSAFADYQQQKAYMDKLRAEKPELFDVEKFFFGEEALAQVGIASLPQGRHEGFLRYYPQDFLVEEIGKDGTLYALETRDGAPHRADGATTLFATLIKVGIPTIEAVKRLAKELGISLHKVGFAGIKDARAITSQRIALPHVRYEDAQKIKAEGFLLTDFAYGKGSFNAGDLQGNAFSIYVRTDGLQDAEKLRDTLIGYRDNGLPNYFYFQRFGGVRLHSHGAGMRIYRGDYEDAIRYFLLHRSPYVMRLQNDMRARAEAVYGDWQAMEKIYAFLPFTFQNELTVVRYLRGKPHNFIGALIAIPQQTQLWVYAYGSYLFNRYLSDKTATGASLPDTIRIFFTGDDEEVALYRDYFEKDRLQHPEESLRPLKFIPRQKRMLSTRLYPKDIAFNVLLDGVALYFVLPKGAYATTLLAHLFRLRENVAPDWLYTQERDVKEDLQMGSVAEVLERLREYVFIYDDAQSDR